MLGPVFLHVKREVGAYFLYLSGKAPHLEVGKDCRARKRLKNSSQVLWDGGGGHREGQHQRQDTRTVKCTTLQGTPNTLLIQASIQPSDFTLPEYLVMLVLALADRSGCGGLGDTALFQVCVTGG